MGGDVEDDLVEVDHQPEEVEIERPKFQVQNLAGAIRVEQVDRDLHWHVRHGSDHATKRVGKGAAEGADREELTALCHKVGDVVDAAEGAAEEITGDRYADRGGAGGALRGR